MPAKIKYWRMHRDLRARNPARSLTRSKASKCDRAGRRSRPLGPCSRPDPSQGAGLSSRRRAIDGVSGPGTVTDEPFDTELPTFFTCVTVSTLRLPTVVGRYRTACRTMGRARQPRTRGMPRGPSTRSEPLGCRGHRCSHRFTPSGVDSHAT
ncbi:MAG: hypothetical protein F4X36_05305 [Gammaproteobacteria bacterium]|nr:hypothetical protein [Gammaproteobacteria bacterium]